MPPTITSTRPLKPEPEPSPTPANPQHHEGKDDAARSPFSSQTTEGDRPLRMRRCRWGRRSSARRTGVGFAVA